MQTGSFNSYIEGDIAALCQNYKTIQQHVGKNKTVVPIVKGNGYGFGSVEAAKALIPLGADIVAVAMVCEGVKLRENGITCPILVLGGVPIHNLPDMVHYDLQAPIFTINDARALNEEAKKQGKIAYAQIKIDTGMHRVGVLAGEALAKLMAELKTLTNVKVVGVYTHFANAEYFDDPFTLEQYDFFKAGVAQLKADSFFELQFIHCQNSNSTFWLKDDICTHCRPGGMIFGYCRMWDGSPTLDVKETITLRSFITAINDVPVGESVGYNRFYKPAKNAKVATVSIGYGCGLYRPMTRIEGMPVLVNDTRTTWAGSCMDQSFVDVTDVDCKVGDEVTVFGYSKGGAHISPYELAEKSGAIYQMFVCSTTERVPRFYKR